MRKINFTTVMNLIAVQAFYAALAFVLATFMGCCQIEPVRDSNGLLIKVNSFKTPLMGDLSFKEKVKTTDPKTGIITERETETGTATNADKIIDSANRFIGTAVNAAEKAGAAMP